jgi:hypothetical protein
MALADRYGLPVSTSSATADPPQPPAMHYVGLDVHQKRSSICILDPHGKQVKRLEVKGHWPAVLAEIARHVPRPFAICYEASCGYGYLYERLAPPNTHSRMREWVLGGVTQHLAEQDARCSLLSR